MDDQLVGCMLESMMLTNMSMLERIDTCMGVGVSVYVGCMRMTSGFIGKEVLRSVIRRACMCK